MFVCLPGSLFFNLIADINFIKPDGRNPCGLFSPNHIVQMKVYTEQSQLY